MKSLQCVPACLLILLAAAIGASADCSRYGADWFEHSGACYHDVSTGEANWFSASIRCQRLNSELAFVRSRSENEFLRSLTSCRKSFWLGLVNTQRSLATENNAHKGYSWWSSDGEFSALNATKVEHQDCVRFDPSGVWQTEYCGKTYGYVCKAPAHTTKDETKGRNDTDVKRKCPNGWTKLNDNCYLVSEGKANHFHAQMHCNSGGATLASVHSWQEHKQLSVLLGCAGDAWIGLEWTKPCYYTSDSRGCWAWMDRTSNNYLHDRSLLAYFPSANYSTEGAECVVHNGNWKVTSCEQEFRYVCKRAAQP